ncbi:hypothetical protein HC031_08965 [Planosporangium thailandense]|uniref:Uncharacterized protein n=1 Tax=Planosporangium thailandense TaxID=765197 RepID=A0ABX0XVK8_9ACTN|nr:hypothetical protein [Planosporangium thailandense]NJC69851.1 hypothetical protein [Planosporangium thailandense]
MNRLERDAASVWHPFTQNSPWHGDRRTVISRIGGSWQYGVDRNRVLGTASPAAVAAGRAAATVPGATKEPQLPPPNPDEPGGPGPTDPEGPTDPKPTDPTDPTGPDQPPAVSRAKAAAGEVTA